METTRLVWLAAILILGLSACAVQQPEVAVRSAKLTSLSTSKMKVEVKVNVSNPNTFTLPVDRVNWSLGLFEEDFSKGRVNLENRIPAQGSRVVTVPLSISYSRAMAGAVKLLSGKPIPYKVNGRFFFDTQAGSLSAPFDDAGRWRNPLSGIQQTFETWVASAEPARTTTKPL